MPEDRLPRDTHDKPSLRLRQRLHQATGDRDAEAAALADRTGDVGEEDALLAVHRPKVTRARGPRRKATATPEDAEATKEERSS